MIGKFLGPAASMDVSEFIEYDVRNEARNYWRSRGVKHSSDPNRRGGDGLIPQLRIGGDIFESIFGSNTIDVRPSGNVELLFGILHNRDDNPNLTARQQKRTEFKFDEKIQANVIAKVGDKISYNLNYNTESNFEFDNQMKLKFEGKEDDIIQLMEFGDVMLPLQSTLITGSQSLFGFKTALRFGKLTVTSVLSESKANTKSITISGGAQMQDFIFVPMIMKPINTTLLLNTLEIITMSICQPFLLWDLLLSLPVLRYGVPILVLLRQKIEILLLLQTWEKQIQVLKGSMDPAMFYQVI